MLNRFNKIYMVSINVLVNIVINYCIRDDNFWKKLICNMS